LWLSTDSYSILDVAHLLTETHCHGGSESLSVTLCNNHSPYFVNWCNRRELTDEEGKMDLVKFEHAIRRQARKREHTHVVQELSFVSSSRKRVDKGKICKRCLSQSSQTSKLLHRRTIAWFDSISVFFPFRFRMHFCHEVSFSSQYFNLYHAIWATLTALILAAYGFRAEQNQWVDEYHWQGITRL
jgi:hypothetical protein